MWVWCSKLNQAWWYRCGSHCSRWGCWLSMRDSNPKWHKQKVNLLGHLLGNSWGGVLQALLNLRAHMRSIVPVPDLSLSSLFTLHFFCELAELVDALFLREARWPNPRFSELTGKERSFITSRSNPGPHLHWLVLNHMTIPELLTQARGRWGCDKPTLR